MWERDSTQSLQDMPELKIMHYAQLNDIHGHVTKTKPIEYFFFLGGGGGLGWRVLKRSQVVPE